MRWLTFLTRGDGGAVERVAVLLCALHCGAAFDELPSSHGEPVLLRGLRVRGKARPPPPPYHHHYHALEALELKA